MEKDHYIFPAIFYYDEDGISVEFPDLPGCLTCADTEREALSMAKEALTMRLYSDESDGTEIPEPTRASDIIVGSSEPHAIMLIKVERRC